MKSNLLEIVRLPRGLVILMLVVNVQGIREVLEVPRLSEVAVAHIPAFGIIDDNLTGNRKVVTDRDER